MLMFECVCMLLYVFVHTAQINTIAVVLTTCWIQEV